MEINQGRAFFTKGVDWREGSGSICDWWEKQQTPSHIEETDSREKAQIIALHQYSPGRNESLSANI